MSMAPSQLGCFTRSSPEHEWPNVEYHVQPLSLDAFGEPLHRTDAFTASVCNLNPQSRGHVRIRSPRFDDAPSILANYLSTDADRRVAADSLRLTRRIVQMPALAGYAPREMRPGVQFQSDDELARLAGDIGTTIFHPVGTCKMGRADDPLAVVDARLRVLGVARPARGRCQRDADHHQRQHQRADDDDCRAGSGVDARRRGNGLTRGRIRHQVGAIAAGLVPMLARGRPSTVRPPRVPDRLRRQARAGLGLRRQTSGARPKVWRFVFWGAASRRVLAGAVG